jgi:Arc/MetJ family transcription regulator
MILVMTKRVVEINDELLQDAFAVLGTSTVTATVNRALAHVREAAVQRTMSDQALRRGGWVRVEPSRHRWSRRSA